MSAEECTNSVALGSPVKGGAGAEELWFFWLLVSDNTGMGEESEAQVFSPLMV